MAARTTVKGIAAKAQRDDAKARAKSVDKTLDSFVNFAQRLGVGAESPLSTSTYGFNPITRNRTMLEWIHRGSWLGGVAVDLVANDMTRAGVEFLAEMDPDDQEQIEHKLQEFGVWNAVNETLRWGRLYGGAIAVALIDGQDMRTPLLPGTIGPGGFRGLLCLDRWMVEPALEDLVTEFGPNLGLPKYYRVQANAPALRGVAIHHSRVMIRDVGVELPYQQRLTENLWGISVLERLYDRMIGFDSATTGVSQLVYKSYLRTLSVKGLREVVAAGGAQMAGLTAYVDTMRRFQGIEGITMVDADDKFEAQGTQAFSGLGEALDKLKEQLCGALEIPATRLFGVSGGGLNGTSGSDLQLYYDSVKQQQIKKLLHGLTACYKMQADSLGITVPQNFALAFRSLWEISDTDKSTIAKSTLESVTGALDSQLISPKTALKELRQSSRRTGIFTNITEEQIDQADDEIQPPPGAEGAIGPDGQPLPTGNDEGAQDDPDLGQGPTGGPEGQASPLDAGASRRAQVRPPPPVARPPSGGDRPGDDVPRGGA